MAAEFTFFLAIPAMFGASLFETDQIRFPFYRRRIWSSDAWMYRVFLDYRLLRSSSLWDISNSMILKVFGYYRIVLGGLIIVWTIIQTVIA